MLSFPSAVKVYACIEPVDMHKSYDGLCGCVERRKKHPGRNAIPENIETVIHNVDLTVEEKQCVNGCGEFVKIREEQRTIIELEPAKYVKHIYIQPVYGCKTFKDALVLKEMPLVSPLPRIKCCSHTSFMWVYVNGE